MAAGSHHRRRSSVQVQPLHIPPNSFNGDLATSSSVPNTSTPYTAPTLAVIPGTPVAGQSPMSLSRSPSPRPGGGWSSPGLTGSSRASSPGRHLDGAGYFGNANGGASWAAAKAKSEQVRGYPSFSTRNNGFFSRQRRKISASLPRFKMNAVGRHTGAFGPGKDPRPGLGEGSLPSRVLTLLNNLLRRTRIRLLLVFALALVLWLVYRNREFAFPLFLFSANIVSYNGDVSRVVGIRAPGRINSSVQYRRWGYGVERRARMGH